MNGNCTSGSSSTNGEARQPKAAPRRNKGVKQTLLPEYRKVKVIYQRIDHQNGGKDVWYIDEVEVQIDPMYGLMTGDLMDPLYESMMRIRPQWISAYGYLNDGWELAPEYCQRYTWTVVPYGPVNTFIGPQVHTLVELLDVMKGD